MSLASPTPFKIMCVGMPLASQQQDRTGFESCLACFGFSNIASGAKGRDGLLEERPILQVGMHEGAHSLHPRPELHCQQNTHICQSSADTRCLLCVGQPCGKLCTLRLFPRVQDLAKSSSVRERHQPVDLSWSQLSHTQQKECTAGQVRRISASCMFRVALCCNHFSCRFLSTKERRQERKKARKNGRRKEGGKERF
jgi:hypothetical protein